MSFLAFFSRDYFVSFLVSQVIGETIQLTKSRNLPYQSVPNTLFILSFCIIPLLYLVVRSISQLNSSKKRLLSNIIIINFGVIFWVFRIIYLKYKAIHEIGRIPFENMNFDLFLFVGFIFETLFKIVIFRQKKRILRIFKMSKQLKFLFINLGLVSGLSFLLLQFMNGTEYPKYMPAKSIIISLPIIYFQYPILNRKKN